MPRHSGASTASCPSITWWRSGPSSPRSGRMSFLSSFACSAKPKPVLDCRSGARSLPIGCAALQPAIDLALRYGRSRACFHAAWMARRSGKGCQQKNARGRGNRASRSEHETRNVRQTKSDVGPLRHAYGVCPAARSPDVWSAAMTRSRADLGGCAGTIKVRLISSKCSLPCGSYVQNARESARNLGVVLGRALSPGSA